MSGAIGVDQLKKLPSFIKHRQDNGAYFTELFSDYPYLNIQVEIGKSSWFGFSFVIKAESGIMRKEVVEKLMKEGVEYRLIVSGNVAKNEVAKYFDYEIHGSLSNAEYLDQNGFL